MSNAGTLSFDPNQSVAILIGSNHRGREGGFERLYPAIRNDLWDLGSALRRKDIVGIEDVHMIEDSEHWSVLKRARQACVNAPKPLSALILYYAGHGFFGDGKIGGLDDLYLTTPDTNTDYRHESAIPFAYLRRIVEDARASYPIIFLDCCFSGAAPNLNVDGAFIMMAAGDKVEALWPDKAPNTGFTGSLVSILSNGLPPTPGASKPTISLIDLFNAVKSECTANGCPEPKGDLRLGSEGIAIQFARNVAVDRDVGKADLKALRAAGLGPEIVKAIAEVEAASRVKELDNIVRRTVAEKGAAAPSDPQVMAICTSDHFREYHRSDWTTYDVRQQINEIHLSDDEDKTGDASLVATARVRAAQPIHSIWRYTFGDAPVDGFNLLGIDFQSKPSRNATIVPLINAPTQKEFVAYLNIPLPARENVEHTFRWNWPRMFHALVNKPFKDTWAFSIRSAAPDVVNVVTRFYIPESLGELKIRQTVGPVDGPPELILSKSQKDGTTIYEWRRRKLASNCRVVLELSLEPIDMQRDPM
jgi:Caspase domain